MVKRAVKIQCKDGLEARPIAMLVQKSSQFSSKVHIEVGTKSINAKSIMGMMSLQVENGQEVTVQADGGDETAAMQEIEDFLLHRIASGRA